LTGNGINDFRKISEFAGLAEATKDEHCPVGQ
jgi:hypothetical protein